MPPSVAPESLERHISSESFQSFSTAPNTPYSAYGAGSSKMAMSYRDRYPGNGDGSDEEDEGSVALWERPSWSQSLRRLRWCCPGAAFTVPKGGMEHTSRARTQSESSVSSRSQPSPTPSAPQYFWEGLQQQVPPPAHGWHPHQTGYPPAAWGYPHPAQVQPNYPAGPMPPYGMMYPSPPQLFPSKTYGYAEPKRRSDVAPAVTADTLPVEANYANYYDAATESELSCQNQAPPNTPKQQRPVAKPPLVQRRVTAPVHTSPFLSSHKDASPTFPHKPPLQPLRTKSTHNQTPPRPRLASEMSRNSMASTSSRHRRKVHDSFAFSTSSLHEIAAPGPPPPLCFIEVTQSSISRTNSWSSWEHDDMGLQSASSLLLSLDSEDDDFGYISPVDEEKIAVTTIAPATKDTPEEWMVQWATQQKAGLTPPLSPQRTVSSRTSEAPPVPTEETAAGPVYLPLSFDLDNQVTEAGGTLVLSGWVAVSEGDALRNKLALSETNQLPVGREDIAYLQLVKERGQWNLKFHRSRTDVKVLTLTRSLQVQSQEVCGRAGRGVLLQDAWTRQVLYTILPVSLPNYFFRQGKLLSARNFGLVQSAMFTPFYNATMGCAEWSHEYCLRRYAPDAQHDAAMHILFCLDAALREG